MYPPQTSLIPITIALARFFEERGFSAFFANYPYWYLGSTPYRYLTGPVVSLITVGLHKILPAVSLFSITIYLVIVSFVVAAVGWGILTYQVQSSKFKVQNDDSKIKIVSILVFVLLLILPWRFFSALTLSEASFTIARNLLPWVLLAFWRSLDRNYWVNWGRGLIAVLSTSLLLLINTSILPILVVGLASLILAVSVKKGKFRGIIKLTKPSLFLILTSLFLVTLYYTPGYWWTILANPSIGGASGIKVILRVFDLLKASVPLVLAVFAVYFSGRIKSRLSVFTLTWTLTFLFLSAFRFIGDPDFWMDWSSWFYELEIGIAIISSMTFSSVTHKVLTLFSSAKINNEYSYRTKAILASFVLVFGTFYVSFFVYKRLGKPKLLQDNPPIAVEKPLKALTPIVGNRKVFLSGSTVFWADALYDIYQVRGGRDQVAVHPTWNKAAYELREGSDPEKSLQWLNDLDVAYVMVHEPDSSEYYHDFRSITKWKIIGKAVWEEGGDIIYQVKGKR